MMKKRQVYKLVKQIYEMDGKDFRKQGMLYNRPQRKVVLLYIRRFETYASILKKEEDRKGYKKLANDLRKLYDFNNTLRNNRFVVV